MIVPVMTIVGDTDEERHNERELVRASMSFYGSTPNYSFIWDEAGFEGTTARIREKQKAGDFKGMAAQITDEHIAMFATESMWDGLADVLIEKYDGIATRIVLYNALGDPERFERYGGVARTPGGHCHTPSGSPPPLEALDPLREGAPTPPPDRSATPARGCRRLRSCRCGRTRSGN